MNETEKYNNNETSYYHFTSSCAQFIALCACAYIGLVKDEKLRQPAEQQQQPLLFCCYRSSWEGFALNLNKLFHLLSFNLPAWHAAKCVNKFRAVLFSPIYRDAHARE